MFQKSFRGSVFISCYFFVGLIHITLSFHSILTDTVNDDMRMDVSGLVATVCVGDNQCLITWKIFSSKFQTKFLRPFLGKSAFCYICRIKAEDIMMALLSSFFWFLLNFLFVIRHSLSNERGQQFNSSI